MRLLPSNSLPRGYSFLTYHARKSFIIPYTIDTGTTTSVVVRAPHGLVGASIHDMWYGSLDSVTGNARTDYNPYLEPIYHTPIKRYVSFTNTESYYLGCNDTYVYVHISHTNTGEGIKHYYFHIKLYADDFLADAFTGDVWRTTPNSGK